jgi:RNA polymerase sigma-70 factor (ECF subfamily)
VLKYRQRQRRDRHLFSDEFVRQVASDAVEQADELEQRRQHLAVCLSKLRSNDLELIQQRYASGESGKSVAELIGRPINSVYQSLSRIRRTLLECVNRQIRAQATP